MMRRSVSQSSRTKGFTIVELIIVVVVIAVLVGIVLVAYGGAVNESRQKSLQNDLAQAASAIDSQKNFNDTWLPTSFPSTASVSQGNVLQLTNYTSDPTKYCINGFITNPPTVMSYRSGQTAVYSGLCPGQPVGTPLGGTVPAMPRGVNLVQPLSEWSLSSGTMSYDSANNQLVLTPGASGTYISPLIRVDKATTLTISFDTYATQASSYFTPNSGSYTGMKYFAADGVTPVTNNMNYTNNGNAQAATLNNWVHYSFSYAGGPNVIYIQATINSGTYTSDNKIKNVTVVVN